MAKMKVVQCWDDGVITDIRLIEILKKYNAKATFNLNIGLMKPERGVSTWNRDPFPNRWNYMGYMAGKVGLNELKAVYGGFEVASHCMRHENAGTLPDEEFIKAAVDAKKYLEDLF